MPIHHSEKAMAAYNWSRTAVGDAMTVSRLAFTSGWDEALKLPAGVKPEVIRAMRKQERACSDMRCSEEESAEHVLDAMIDMIKRMRG